MRRRPVPPLPIHNNNIECLRTTGGLRTGTPRTPHTPHLSFLPHFPQNCFPATKGGIYTAVQLPSEWSSHTTPTESAVFLSHHPPVAGFILTPRKALTNNTVVYSSIPQSNIIYEKQQGVRGGVTLVPQQQIITTTPQNIPENNITQCDQKIIVGDGLITPSTSASTRNSTFNKNVRLFVGRIPKNFRSSDLKKIFMPFGNVLEANIIRDRKTLQSRRCGFVRFQSIQEARNAIANLHQRRIFDEELGAVQVKFADGELERLGLPLDCQPGGECIKLFLGNLSNNTTDKDIANIINSFGSYEDLCILTDSKLKKSKCSGFVTFRSMISAQECIKALNGKYTCPGASRPMEVRIAESRTQRKKKKGAGPNASSHAHDG